MEYFTCSGCTNGQWCKNGNVQCVPDTSMMEELEHDENGWYMTTTRDMEIWQSDNLLCDICHKNSLSEDVEKCACGKSSCFECSIFHREYDTGYMRFLYCVECSAKEAEAEEV